MDESAQIDAVYDSALTVNYCCLQGWTGALGGTGNVGDNPCFADATGGDYHLLSEAGRWNSDGESWVTDGNTSPCVDSGDPNSDWTEELWPNGHRINMGAYGGTPQASMSLSDVGNIADLNIDGVVDFRDYGWFAELWEVTGILLAEDLDRNGAVNSIDVGILDDNWLWEQ